VRVDLASAAVRQEAGNLARCRSLVGPEEISSTIYSWRPCLVLASTAETGPLPLLCKPGGNNPRGASLLTFVVGTAKIDVIAHISWEDLGLDRLVLGRFEGSETLNTPWPRRRSRPRPTYRS
jgi:hypothetical protein